MFIDTINLTNADFSYKLTASSADDFAFVYVTDRREIMIKCGTAEVVPWIIQGNDPNVSQYDRLHSCNV